MNGAAIKDQIATIKEPLDVWVQRTNPGSAAFVASDLSAYWYLLLNAPGGLRVVIMYEGEEARVTSPGLEITGMVDRYFTVGITMGRGLKADRAATLTEGTGGGVPLFDLVDQMRDILRFIVWDNNTTERVTYFKRVAKQAVTNDKGMLIDAYQVEFYVGTLLALPAPTNDDTIVPPIT